MVIPVHGLFRQVGVNAKPFSTASEFRRMTRSSEVKPGLRDLSPFCLRRIEGCPESQLPGAKLLCDLTNAALHVVTAQAQRLAVGSQPPQCDMHMGMLGITMNDRDPLQRAAKILVHAEHHIPR